jgi:hypothetical protein
MVVAAGFCKPPWDAVSARVVRGLGGKRSFFGVPSGAERAAAKSLALRRSKAGLVGGVSAALIASSPFCRAEGAGDVPANSHG